MHLPAGANRPGIKGASEPGASIIRIFAADEATKETAEIVMYKYAVLLALVACAAAAPKPGFLAAPAAFHAAPLVAAPAVAVAHSVPVASSYANTYKVSVKSPLVAAAPVVHAAPAIAYAAPAVIASHGYAPAPLAYAAHAPIIAVH